MKDLTAGKEFRLIFNFAMPMLLGNVFQQLYNLVDSAIVGNFIGKEALAAVGASFPIIFTLISLIIGIATGSMVVISQFFGAKDIDKVKSMIETFYIFMFFASILITATGIIFSDKVFKLMQLPEEIMPQAMTYLNIYMLGMISFFGFNGTSAILRGLGDSKTPLYFLMFSTIINIGLDLLFVIVFKWGVAGVAWATIIAQTGAFLSAVLYLNRYHEVIHVKLTGMKFDRALFKKSLQIGIPTGLQHTFVSLGMLAIMGIVNTFGTDVIAGYSVAIRLDSLAIMPAMIFSAALSTFVGQNLGAGKKDRVKKGLAATILMSVTVSLTVTAVMIFFGKYLMGLFTEDAEVIRIGHQYLTIVSSFYTVFAIMFAINGVMRGAGDALIPMFITLIALWLIRIPSALILSGKFGEVGIWWAVPLGMTTGLTLSYLYYLTGRYKNKTVVQPT